VAGCIGFGDAESLARTSPDLKEFLDPLVSQFHRLEYLTSDPLEFVHLHSDPLDQEAVGLLASQLAYGNVKQIRASVRDALERMKEVSDSPSGFIKSLDSQVGVKTGLHAFQTFRHRFQTGTDLVSLFTALSGTWKKEGSLGSAIAIRHRDAEDLGPSLAALLAEWKRELGPHTQGLGHFLASPADGSVCKRWAMYFRWMVRRDALDPGTWAEGSPLSRTFRGRARLRPADLILPLDTHTGRIAGYLGLTKRKSLNWRAAKEITNRLKECDPLDPVKYDFALCRLGILDLCKKEYRRGICESCSLLPVCGYAKRRGRVKR